MEGFVPVQWYMDIPPITWTYLTAVAVTTLASELEFISPLHLYFNVNAIRSGEVWRIVTTFLYFGQLGLDLLFHMWFLYNYSRKLEEGSFRGRTADYVFMLLFGATLMLLVAPFVDLLFLGTGLTTMLTYVWSKRNARMRVLFLGLYPFTVDWLPWVLLGLGILFNQNPVADLLGIFVGHCYYFLEDVYPRRTNRRLLPTPRLLRWLCGERIEGTETPSTREDEAPRQPGAWRGPGRRVNEDAPGQ